LQLDSTQKVLLKQMATVPSSVQGYALAVLELIGDTIIYHAPEINDSPAPRLGKFDKTEVSEAEQVFTIYPNPNSGLFTIGFKKPEGIYSIMLTDLTGRIQLKAVTQNNQKSIQLNANELGKGVYLCAFYTDGVLMGTERLVLIK
jgi:hypothetical protein